MQNYESFGSQQTVRDQVALVDMSHPEVNNAAFKPAAKASDDSANGFLTMTTPYGHDDLLLAPKSTVPADQSAVKSAQSTTASSASTDKCAATQAHTAGSADVTQAAAVRN